MRYFVIFIIIFSITFLYSCFKDTKNEKFSKIQILKISKNYRRIQGVVKKTFQGDIFIIINPDCKCRRSFKVIGSKKEELKKLNGLFVEVEGYIKEYTPWSGEILVEKIHILEK
ncbi:MAG: hypothetical protein DSY60_01425 [Persephonella sp.]|nr:MAG: hypothetical protein DSY60_01425 [Persephonella sp.]